MRAHNTQSLTKLRLCWDNHVIVSVITHTRTPIHTLNGTVNLILTPPAGGASVAPLLDACTMLVLLEVHGRRGSRGAGSIKGPMSTGKLARRWGAIPNPGRAW